MTNDDSGDEGIHYSNEVDDIMGVHSGNSDYE
jgi:hypothetical protein